MNTRFSKQFVLSQHNLKIWKENGHQKVLKYSSMVLQKFSHIKTFKDFQELLKSKKFLEMISNMKNQKQQQNAIFKVWVHHCECVLTQRIRRCQQMFFLYTAWWEERALKDFLQRMRHSLVKRGRELTLGAVGISSYNWEKNRITEEEFKKHIAEFDYIDVLKENTICLSCASSKRSNNNTSLCKCGTTGQLPNKSYDEWTPFIEKQDLIVWRRSHASGQYEYKVFGSYNDVSALDFLNVQVDTDYRRKWDNTAVMLEIAEKDPVKDANGDILYWEMKWPRLFVNRDYIFVRRYLIDKEHNLIFIINKTTEHPKFPKYPDKFRVEEYWSIMVLRPYTDMDKIGLEFSLTYFDNPGVNIPSSIQNWIATRAMPDFLDRLRKATVEYRQYCVKEGVSADCLKIAAEEKAAKEQRERDKLDYCNFERDSQKAINFSREFQNLIDNKKFHIDAGKNVDIVASSDVAAPSAQTLPSSKSFWKYFHPLYYFH